MKTKNLIIGGGLSGLIMGMELTKRNEDYIIIERSKNLIEAKLHYLHADLKDYLPFKLQEIDIVQQWFDGEKFRSDIPTADVMNNFSFNTVGKIFQNSMKYMDGKIHKGYIPENGIENISPNVLNFNKNEPLVGYDLTRIDHENKIAYIDVHTEADGQEVVGEEKIEYERIISTIPLPIMLKIAGVEHEEKFETDPLHMFEIELPEDVQEGLFQIIYLPFATGGYSRFSILGKRCVAEVGRKDMIDIDPNRVWLKKFMLRMFPNLVDYNLSDIKIEKHTNWYGRYHPINNGKRVELIKQLENKDIFCLGRYAAWDYKRTDHVVKDAEVIANSSTLLATKEKV